VAISYLVSDDLSGNESVSTLLAQYQSQELCNANAIFRIVFIEKLTETVLSNNSQKLSQHVLT